MSFYVHNAIRREQKHKHSVVRDNKRAYDAALDMLDETGKAAVIHPDFI
jgi:hypothetical protein